MNEKQSTTFNLKMLKFASSLFFFVELLKFDNVAEILFLFILL